MERDMNGYIRMDDRNYWQLVSLMNDYEEQRNKKNPIKSSRASFPRGLREWKRNQ